MPGTNFIGHSSLSIFLTYQHCKSLRNINLTEISIDIVFCLWSYPLDFLFSLYKHCWKQQNLRFVAVSQNPDIRVTPSDSLNIIQNLTKKPGRKSDRKSDKKSDRKPDGLSVGKPDGKSDGKSVV